MAGHRYIMRRWAMRTETAQLLLTQGAEINAKTDKGPHTAIRGGGEQRGRNDRGLADTGSQNQRKGRIWPDTAASCGDGQCD